MGKLNFISGLAAEAADRVTQDEKSWKEFLQTASRLYRYDFDDQLLIYAQRPDATACAPLEMWNEKMRRWIKPGSKGIALIHKRRDGSNRLDYVFDVSDTRPVHGAREPYLWELREEYRAPVLEALEKRFGETKGQDTAERLKEIVTGAVLETFSDYLQDLEYDSWGSPLEGVDVAEWEDIFRETMEASVQYAVLTRCGFCPEDYVKDMFLSGITLFSTPAVLHHLGDACSRLTMEICTEIRREIRRLEQEVARDKEKEHKNTENLLEKTPKEVYSESIEKFSTVKRESEKKGGNEYGRTGADIQESRGLPDTGSGDGRSGHGQSGDNAHREVRTAQGELPEGTPSRDLHIHAADGETGWAPAGSGERGQRADRPDPGTAYESGRGGREAESIGSDAVDPAGRRHDSPGGGNGAAGSGLQVGQAPETSEKQNMDKDETAGAYPAVFSSTERGGQLSLFPSAEEQVEKIAQVQAEEKRDAPAPGQHVKNLPEELDHCLNSALAGGGNESDSILRIVAFYQKGPDNKQAAAFLQEEFGVGGKGILVDGVKVSVWFGKDGLFFARGNSALVPCAVLVPWERAAARVRKLLEKGTFAAQDKLDGARDYEYQRLAESMWYLAQSLSDEAGEKGYLPYLRELCGGFPDSTEKIAALLREPGYRHVFCAELDTFIQALQKKPELLRYRRYHPERVRKEIESLNISPRQFYCTEGFEPVKGYFITEDEIDQMLRRGSGVSEGKLRIYSYIMQGHDAKECAAFLRTEYGVGGWGHAGYDEWHDSKGIQFKRADDDSGYQGYDTVFLHWNQVQERIRGLIRDGKYLGAKELEYLPEYEKMQLARELYHFKQLTPDRPGSTPNVLWDMEKGVAEFRPVLDSPKYSAELYEDMVKTFAPLLPEEVHGYETMKKALEDMGAFVRGEYSLFQPLSASVLEAEKDRSRRRKEAEKEAKRQERQMAETPKERQPEGELEKAARALAKKQRAQVATRQEMDGQLSLDFSSMGALWADHERTAGQTEAGPVPERYDIRQEKTQVEEGQVAEEQTAEGQTKKGPDPRLTPHAEEYLALKALHPDKLIAVQVGELYLFYGKDAETVAPVLDAKLLKREIDGLGETFVTGTKSWQGAVRKALEHGHSILVIGPEPGKGMDAPYVTIKERSAADYIPLGMQLTIDGRRMMIDSVDFGRGKVSLKDLDLQGWFPVFREESVAYVRECIEQEADREAETEASVEAAVEAAEKAGETDAADLEEAKREEGSGPKKGQERLVPSDTAEVFDVGLPFEVVFQKLITEEEREKERRLRDRRDYRITDDNLGAWGQKTRYQNNIEAVRTLKQIEAEGRNATGEEQEILAKYTGWGGLSQVFDPANDKWGKEYAQLSGLLTPDEYESARATVLNAFYTSPLVIKSVYAALERMEFVPGNILEPSCGAGNFLGLLPEGFAGAKLYGVELDNLTGRIASQLYQKADITIGGFETTNYPDSFFDLALGNVPFGDYKVHDRNYDRLNLNIHDYFLVKALDKVRPGGVMAFITSKGTMDKADGRAREALAQKADLLGAIRLPNHAFKANAGTDVTSDILFFQKRGSAPEKLPDWVAVGETEDGVPLNSYYLQHPEMVLGKMSFWKNMYGNETETACLPTEGADLAGQLAEAVTRIGRPDRALLEMGAPERQGSGATGKAAVESIAADPDVRNFSFTVKDRKLYYRENSRMTLVEPGKKRTERIRDMIGIRDSARRLIEIQTAGASDSEVREEQKRLNSLYDGFVKKHGLLNSKANRQAFQQDASYPLLCSLEILDEEGQFQAKADIFTKRTICHRQPVTHADTAVEALGVSIGERACVDLGFMASLMGGPEKIPQIVKDLKGIIFKDPDTGPFDMEGEAALWYKGWQTQDAYLSGNVREKLEKARKAAEEYPEFAVNVEALEAVQPKDLTAPEINVRIGAPWIDKKYYNEFLYDLLKTPHKLRGTQIEVIYSDVAGAWNVTGKRADSLDNTRVYGTYGTKRINAYGIFEDSLNQKSVEVYDTVEVDGKEKRVLNAKETAIAQQKQEAMKEAFREWIFKDPERRADLCATYNRLFNSLRPREYDGQHIQFGGMNPEIALEKHQRDAVARVLYGGNTLLAHVVGAGKTYECIAAAMEGKRLGLCRKSMMVVPNHLTEQWGSDFLTLYPGAKVLVATKKDFEPKNRRKFCARIATGDYDAVILGQTQFEKIPISPERQTAQLEEQIREIMDGIETAKEEKQERWTIRQMEITKKNLEGKLKRLMDKKRDDTVYFEELGVDRLFVDEAQYYKNLYTYTKMRNVAGIGQVDAQKSSDMYAKCRYMDEITGGRGVVFATGTPISNTMVELYTMMRYLQDDMLRGGYKDSAGKVHSLVHFDNWAATFGECVTAVELKPEGTGFRLRTRFARFYNLPELMNLWKEAADIQTADMLNLPTPDVEYVTVQTEASAAQKKMVEALAERAEKIRSGGVDASIDNMLKITSDGRKLALDQRLMNPLLGDDPGSKVNACVETVFRIWQDSTEFQGTQLIFSDLSTPRRKREEKEPEGGDTENTENGAQKETEEVLTEENLQEYGVYEDIRQKLTAKGIPKEQIAFIHEAHTEAKKAELFAKVRSGQVRVLLGSTQKMGAGTNVQTRLVASHDLDCPWRPADLEQRAGRIVRRGNQNEKVWIYRYVTKGTFDAYTWGLVESKQKFIGQVMTSKSPARSIEDVDEAALSYAEVKMLATGDPRIKEKMDLDIQVTKLKMLKANHTALKYELEDKIRGHFPNKIKEEQLYIDCLQADLTVLQSHPAREGQFSMVIQGVTYAERKEAGQALIAACHLLSDPGREFELGEYRGFPMRLGFDGTKFKVTMKQHLTYTAKLSDDAVGNIARINNALDRIPQSLKKHEEQMERLKRELENAKEEAEKPFPQEAELAEKSARLTELNTELDNAERNRGWKPDKDGAESRRQDGRAAENSGLEDTARTGKKPSILNELRQYERPEKVSAVAEREKTAIAAGR